MADFYNITGWAEKNWFQTGGTRNKLIVVNPTNKFDYYFKCSLKKEARDYRFEFWSEIIASEVGILLGFDMLKYDIAYNGHEVGCISESMIKENINKLTEGRQYLTAFSPSYNPELPISKKEYTFQFIENSLKSAGLSQFINNIVQIIIFDSIIGNGDRHQENWGIITKYSQDSKQTIISIIKRIGLKKAIKFLIDDPVSFGRRTYFIISKLVKKQNLDSFAKIYDSGSSLGRELSDERINSMLLEPQLIISYINRGPSEIHWNSVKCSHFELINHLQIKYNREVKRVVNRIRKRYNKQLIIDIVDQVDYNLPEEHNQNRPSECRKNFIINLLTLRIELLLSKFK